MFQRGRSPGEGAALRALTVHLLAVLAGLWLMAGGGCATMEARGGARVFDDTVETYVKLLRWGSFEEAASFHAPRHGDLDPIDLDRLKEIRVTSLDIKDKVLNPDGDAGEVRFTIEFYNDYEGVVGSLNVHQAWWYDEQAHAWRVDGQLPPLR